MRSVLKMTQTSLRMSYRVGGTFVFQFIFPVVMMVVYLGQFGGGVPSEVAKLIGPLMTLTILNSSLLMVSTSIVVQRQRDQLRRYHLTPITASQMVASYLTYGYLILMPVITMQFLAGLLFFDMPFNGSILGMFIVFSLGYLTLTSLAVVLSTAVDTPQAANVIAQLLFFAMVFMSGTTMPFEDLPETLRRVAVFMPPTLMIVASQGLAHGDGLMRHLPEIGALALTLASAFTGAVLLFRWEKEEKVTLRNRVLALLVLVPMVITGIVLNRYPELVKPPEALAVAASDDAAGEHR